MKKRSRSHGWRWCCLPRNKPLCTPPAADYRINVQALEAELDAAMAVVARLHPSTSPSGKQLTLLKDLAHKQDKKVP